jgi:hypothetical protein
MMRGQPRRVDRTMQLSRAQGGSQGAGRLGATLLEENLMLSLRAASRSSTAWSKGLPSRPASRAAVLRAMGRRGSFKLTSVSRAAARTDWLAWTSASRLARSSRTSSAWAPACGKSLRAARVAAIATSSLRDESPARINGSAGGSLRSPSAISAGAFQVLLEFEQS